MSKRAHMLLAYADALRCNRAPQHAFSWEHCARVIAASIIAGHP